jgi:hypothetical protein
MIMKTKTLNFTTFGNTCLVQLEVKPETTIGFKPGELFLKSAELIISEMNAGGVVKSLLAENHSEFFLLLTDADILMGAKQNRILNKSVLLAPHAKTIIDVSCVERGRWSFTTKNFSSPSAAADPDLRRDKVMSFSKENADAEPESFKTQSQVWNHISARMQFENFDSASENYSDLINSNMKNRKKSFPECSPQEGATGLALIVDGSVSCIDLFGTDESYRHYFPRLRDSAFLRALADKDVEVDHHEFNFRILDLLDRYELSARRQDLTYSGAGKMLMFETKEFIGFDLNHDEQRIHTTVFLK